MQNLLYGWLRESTSQLMHLSPMFTLLHAEVSHRPGAPTCYIVAQQYSDRFPEIVMIELSNGSDTPHFQYRFEVMRDIEAGWNYYTAEAKQGKLVPLQKVGLVKVGSEQFLRIDGRAEARDFLGDIPEI